MPPLRPTSLQAYLAPDDFIVEEAPQPTPSASPSVDPTAPVYPDTATLLGIGQARAGVEGMTHDGLIAAYKKYAVRLGWPRASDSSIRTRCNELWRSGEVVRVEERAGRSGMGRTAILWRAADVQSNETADNAGASL